MPNPSPSEIWLVHFPFSDLTSAKVRPALVLATHKQDVIILGIFSKIPSGKLSESWILIDSDDLSFGPTGLAKTSLLRADKIATAHQSTFQRRLGTLPTEFQPRLKIALQKALNLT